MIPEIVANNGTFSEERGWRLTFADLPPCQHFSSATGIPMPAFTEDVWIPPLLWLGFATLFTTMVVLRNELLSATVERSVDASYAIAKSAVTKHKPDVVVGYSWGGGLAMQLMKEGIWSGPTVLVSPLHEVMWHEQSRADPTRWHCKLQHPEQVLVAHAKGDQFVELEKAQVIYKANGFTVEEIDASSHKLEVLSVDDRLHGLVRCAYDIGDNLKRRGEGQEEEPEDEDG